MLGAILGGVASTLAGGLLSSATEQEPQEYPTLDLKKLVADAQANGFNPLTVLNATGGQGFQTGQIGSADFDFGRMAAGAVLSGVGDYFANESRRRLENAEIDLIEAQTRLAQRNAETMAGPRLGHGRQAPAVRMVQTPTRSLVEPFHNEPATATNVTVPTVHGPFPLPATPDTTTYNAAGDPVELETWLMGAALTGEAPSQLTDLGRRNYPRITDTANAFFRGVQGIYDAVTGYDQETGTYGPVIETRPSQGPRWGIKLY